MAFKNYSQPPGSNWRKAALGPPDSTADKSSATRQEVEEDTEDGTDECS
jgi:hypothetical protein